MADFVLAGLLMNVTLVVFACSVCFAADGKTLQAYFGITLFLTALPIALGYLLYRFVRSVDNEQ